MKKSKIIFLVLVSLIYLSVPPVQPDYGKLAQCIELEKGIYTVGKEVRPKLCRENSSGRIRTNVEK